eukprot:1475921-Prymnesium_polylepis.1
MQLGQVDRSGRHSAEAGESRVEPRRVAAGGGRAASKRAKRASGKARAHDSDEEPKLIRRCA